MTYGVDVNLLAVVVAAVVGMAIGMFWYSPAFLGKAWIKASGMSKGDMKKGKKGMGGKMLLGFISTFVMAYALAILIGVVGASTFSGGITAGLFAGIGFIATLLVGNVIWEGKPWNLYFINTFYWLVVLGVEGAIIASWA